MCQAKPIKMRHFNKKGDSQLMLVAGEIVGAFIVAVILLAAAINWADSDIYYRIYLTRDLGIMTAAVMQSPGNIIVDYPENLSRYYVSINLESDEVLICNPQIEKDEKQKECGGRKAEHKLPKQSRYQSIFEFLEPNKLFFIKSGDDFIVSESNPASINTLPCIHINAENPLHGKSTFLIDPGYRQDNKEPNSNICTLSNILFLQYLKPKYEMHSTRFLLDERGIICNNPEKDQSKNYENTKPNIILSIRPGDYPGQDQNTVKAYVIHGSPKYEESRILACNLINSILGREGLKDVEITGASIVPVDIDTVSEIFPSHILPSAKEDISEFKSVFIFLEIGNEQTIQGKFLLESKTASLAGAISEVFT